MTRHDEIKKVKADLQAVIAFQKKQHSRARLPSTISMYSKTLQHLSAMEAVVERELEYSKMVVCWCCDKRFEVGSDYDATGMDNANTGQPFCTYCYEGSQEENDLT